MEQTKPVNCLHEYLLRGVAIGVDTAEEYKELIAEVYKLGFKWGPNPYGFSSSDPLNFPPNGEPICILIENDGFLAWYTQVDIWNEPINLTDWSLVKEQLKEGNQ